MLSRDIPRNDAFAQMYQTIKKGGTDLKFILKNTNYYCHIIVMKQN